MKLRHLLPAVLLLTALPAAGQDSLRVFLVGDSTGAAKDLGKQNPERGWGHMFAPLFDASVTVENHAVNGRSTKSFRDEGRWDAVLSAFSSDTTTRRSPTRPATPRPRTMPRICGATCARHGSGGPSRCC